MVYVLINLKAWNAITIGGPVLWVSTGVHGIATDRIKLYSHTFTPCGGHVAEGNT